MLRRHEVKCFLQALQTTCRPLISIATLLMDSDVMLKVFGKVCVGAKNGQKRNDLTWNSVCLSWKAVSLCYFYCNKDSLVVIFYVQVMIVFHQFAASTTPELESA